MEQRNMMGSLFYWLVEHSILILFIYDLFNNDDSTLWLFGPSKHSNSKQIIHITCVNG
jgi:hypothetical protein